MNYPATIALLALGVSLVAGAQGRDTTEELIAIEQTFNQALIHGEWKTVESLVAEDLVFTDAGGTVSGKSDQLEQIKSGYLRLDSIEMSKVKVQDLGNVAVVTGKLVEKGRYKNADAGGIYRFTDVWAKRNGKWMLVTGQETRRAESH
jgi:ketosteroid isomerase-like protein